MAMFSRTSRGYVALNDIPDAGINESQSYQSPTTSRHGYTVVETEERSSESVAQSLSTTTVTLTTETNPSTPPYSPSTHPRLAVSISLPSYLTSAPPAYRHISPTNDSTSGSDSLEDDGNVHPPHYNSIESSLFPELSEEQSVTGAVAFRYVDFLPRNKLRQIFYWRIFLAGLTILNLTLFLILLIWPEWWINSDGYLRTGLFQSCEMNACTYGFHHSKITEGLRACFIASFQMELGSLAVNCFAPLFHKRVIMKSICEGLRWACVLLSLIKAVTLNCGMWVNFALLEESSDGTPGICYYLAWLLCFTCLLSVVSSFFSVAVTSCLIRVPLD
eukprot:Awhi_evm1s8555